MESVQSQQVLVAPNTDPVIGSAGDIACDPLSPAFNNGQGTDWQNLVLQNARQQNYNLGVTGGDEQTRYLLINHDAPDHTKLRQIVSRAFTHLFKQM